MHPQRKQKLFIILFMLGGIALAVTLMLVALKENINLFYTPTQIAAGEAPVNRTIRAGGMVVEGSVSRAKDGLTVQFDVTDGKDIVTIQYEGILPDLFREGQGIVALGKLNENKVFIASEVLAKHDENYMPPEVADALEKAHNDGTQDVKSARY
ncbi:cytochrome c maturation protein CcmE [Bermanella sp. WJH001]|uniref:cytochrome c maturation protein CcmE n=1 Tax=Bermanella sp. WJH001 TaxID=3048005 RepID=UPI0024BEB7D9|nr:cytochrome c maturation protein CcmE [Bermanella sp. WJH001]MDJ1536744.1 cytochrome c maturation protein CcmE [Bermanella sp. WJH001]